MAMILLGHLVRIRLVSIFSEKKNALRPRKYPYILGKVSENPKGMDIQMSKYDLFEHWNSARGVRWATIWAGKNQGLIAWGR